MDGPVSSWVTKVNEQQCITSLARERENDRIRTVSGRFVVLRQSLVSPA